MKPSGQIVYYASRLDAELQPLALCVSDASSEPLPLIVELSPGSISDLAHSSRKCAEIVAHAASSGERCLVIKPGQRGPGTVGQGPGEVDILEAIDWARGHFPVDPDRISLLGASMGGAAVLYMAAHHPDLFSAAAPFCGYGGLDHWEKPGGPILCTQPWEAESWRSRDATYRAENLLNTSLWITHGAWDAAIGPGVSVEHSRRLVRRLGELGATPRYTEVPECGHGCMTDSTLPPVVAWLCRQRRVSSPARVHLTAHTLRHNRAYWVSIDAFEAYGAAARVEAHREGPRVRVVTANVRRLTLGPIPGAGTVDLAVDNTGLGRVELGRASMSFIASGGGWEAAPAGRVAGKRHGCSGPMGDLFYEPQRFVFGGSDDPHEAFVLTWLSEHLGRYFRATNGGVHRGVFAGESWYNLPVTRESDLTDEEIETCNLVVYGSKAGAGVFRRLGAASPVVPGRGGIEIRGRVFEGEGLGYMVLAPHPRGGDRYVAVVGGGTPEALGGCSHLGLQLLPDWIVWKGAEAWWGCFDNAWGAQHAEGPTPRAS